ncbi:MAG: hypothetical protein SCM96_13470 [Acidobacteriota bacterium]|nr:hypothetical protein [Acidobacteriota bacterium]
MDTMEKKRGHYLGTEIDGKWWRRYAKDGLLARGIGEFGMDESFMIAFRDVLDVKVGKWHSGKWAGGQPVVKIIWKKADRKRWFSRSGITCSRLRTAPE